jgi:GNAT superfamily N-acetyltransferase
VSYVRFAAHGERPIPRRRCASCTITSAGNDRETKETSRRSSEPALGAWDADRLVGFARAPTDGHFAACVGDVMAHEAYRGRGVRERLLSLPLVEIGDVAIVNLSCEPPVARFYEDSGFERTSCVLVQRTGAQPRVGRTAC